MRIGRAVAATVALAVVVVGCDQDPGTNGPVEGVTATPAPPDEARTEDESAQAAADEQPRTPASATPSPSATPTPEPSPSRVPAPEASEPPDWYRQRMLEVTDTGFPAPQETPEVYRDRRIITEDHLPPPPTEEYEATIQPIPEEIVPISTWEEGCPTTLDELRYLTVSYWGFDELHHTGELIVHRDVAEDVVGVFEQLHAARFPMEQVGLLDDEDFTQFHRRGDDNLTAAYQCRATTGSSRWSQHAFGRAIDINPFHNPYLKEAAEGRIVLPAYATAYLDRERDWPGMIKEGDVVVEAFDSLGWGWGGRWTSLKDWQHFSTTGT